MMGLGLPGVRLFGYCQTEMAVTDTVYVVGWLFCDCSRLLVVLVLFEKPR